MPVPKGKTAEFPGTVVVALQESTATRLCPQMTCNMLVLSIYAHATGDAVSIVAHCGFSHGLHAGVAAMDATAAGQAAPPIVAAFSVSGVGDEPSTRVQWLGVA